MLLYLLTLYFSISFSYTFRASGLSIGHGFFPMSFESSNQSIFFSSFFILINHLPSAVIITKLTLYSHLCLLWLPLHKFYLIFSKELRIIFYHTTFPIFIKWFFRLIHQIILRFRRHNSYMYFTYSLFCYIKSTIVFSIMLCIYIRLENQQYFRSQSVFRYLYLEQQTTHMYLSPY